MMSENVYFSVVHFQGKLTDGAAVGDRLYAVSLNEDFAAYKSETLICLNSTISHLFTELHGRVNLGEGALDIMTYEVAGIPVLLPNLISAIEMPITSREILPVQQELAQADRQDLDNIIFDVLGLTSGERDAVYEAVIDLVSKRLQRAQTITN